MSLETEAVDNDKPADFAGRSSSAYTVVEPETPYATTVIRVSFSTF